MSVAVLMGVVCLPACSGDAGRGSDPSTAPASGQSSVAADEARCFGRKATIIGTDGDDELVAGRGRDVIVGLGGDDVVREVGPRDRVCAGGGDDIVPRAWGPPWGQVMTKLGPGDDAIATNSFVDAGSGDDVVRMRGAGVFVVLGPGSDRVDVLALPGRTPCVDYRRAGAAIRADLRAGWARGQGRDDLGGVRCLFTGREDDRVRGSRLDDDLLLGGGANVARTGGGNDFASGGAGVDSLRLGPGRDSGYGDAGADRIDGGGGNDNISGAAGSDVLRGGPGDDRVYGTSQCDPASSAGTGMGDPAPNQVHGGPGDDLVTGDLGDDVINGGVGYDRGYGGPHARPGNDVMTSVERLIRCG